MSPLHNENVRISEVGMSPMSPILLRSGPHVEAESYNDFCRYLSTHIHNCGFWRENEGNVSEGSAELAFKKLLPPPRSDRDFVLMGRCPAEITGVEEGKLYRVVPTELQVKESESSTQPLSLQKVTAKGLQVVREKRIGEVVLKLF